MEKTKSWKERDISVLTDYENTQQANIRLNQARLAIQRRRLFLYLKILFGIVILVGSLAIYIVLDIRRVEHLFQDLVTITDKTTSVTHITGRQIALCLTNFVFNRWFGPGVNPNFAEALWVMWYTKPVRQRLIALYAGNIVEESTGLVPMWTAAVQALQQKADQNPTYNVHQLICKVTNATPQSSVGSMCFPICPLLDNTGNMDVGMGAMQGGLGMAGSIGGIGMMLGGPAGLIAGGIGMVVGSIFGGMRAQAAKQKYIRACKAQETSTTCYRPPTYPSCN